MTYHVHTLTYFAYQVILFALIAVGAAQSPSRPAFVRFIGNPSGNPQGSQLPRRQQFNASPFTSQPQRTDSENAPIAILKQSSVSNGEGSYQFR